MPAEQKRRAVALQNFDKYCAIDELDRSESARQMGARCGSSATARPRLSHMPARMRSFSVASFSGRARVRRRPERLAPYLRSSAPTVQLICPGALVLDQRPGIAGDARSERSRLRQVPRQNHACNPFLSLPDAADRPNGRPGPGGCKTCFPPEMRSTALPPAHR